MKIISISALAALIVAAFAQSPAPAQKRKREIREVIATGCVHKVADDCLLLRTLDGKTTYNILTTDPTPVPGTVITIDGKPHDGSTNCKQGIAIDVTRWESSGESCVP